MVPVLGSRDRDSLTFVLWLSGEASRLPGSVSVSLDLVPWLPGGSWLPGFTFWFPQLGAKVAWGRFLVAWIHFLLPSTWFHSWLVKVPGCLDSVLGSMDLVPSLRGGGS